MAKQSRASLSLVIARTRRSTSDAELATALAAGEAWAIAETWHRFAPMVILMAERTLGSRSEAEDLAQNVFYRLFLRAKTLRNAESLRSFVYSFAVRALKSELRARRVRAWLSFRQPEALADIGSASLDVESRDLLRRFHGLLGRLAPREQLVFTLRRTESMTVEEIAVTMDISLSTVKRSLSYASSRLSRWIEAEPELAERLAKSDWGKQP